MAKRANVADTGELKRFRARLIKFADEVRVSLADADGDVVRTLAWLEGEAPNFWQLQVRKLHEQVQQAKAAVREKRTRKTPTGAKPSTALEEKQLKLLERKLEHAQEKLLNTKRWRQKLDKEVLSYRGVTQRAHGVVEGTIPMAVSELDRAMDALEQYAALAAPQAGRPATEASDADSIARSLGEIPADEPESPEDSADETGDKEPNP